MLEFSIKRFRLERIQRFPIDFLFCTVAVSTCVKAAMNGPTHSFFSSKYTKPSSYILYVLSAAGGLFSVNSTTTLLSTSTEFASASADLKAYIPSISLGILVHMTGSRGRTPKTKRDVINPFSLIVSFISFTAARRT